VVVHPIAIQDYAENIEHRKEKNERKVVLW